MRTSSTFSERATARARFCWRTLACAPISCAALLASLLSSCTHEKDAEIPEPTARSASPASGPDAEIVAECDQAADGTPCGERGRGLHCLFSACVRNSCGDGIKAEDEECDDGNERDGDSCSARCLLESCGNGALDLGEECDDGNNTSADGCSARCRLERCGNRVIDPGEECDDGNTRDDDICSTKCKMQMLKTPDAGPADPGGPANPGPIMDSGASEMDAGGTNMDAGTPVDSGTATESGAATGTDSGPPPPVDAGPALADPRSAECKACMENEASPCRDFQATGVDLVAGCVKPDDPAWTRKCLDALYCSLEATDLCAGDLTRGPVSCYCGVSRSIDDCFKTPGATTGPVGACIARWEAATGCAAGDNLCVSSNFVSLTLPAGFANFFASCAVTDCASACWSTAGLIRGADAGAPADGGTSLTQDQ